MDVDEDGPLPSSVVTSSSLLPHSFVCRLRDDRPMAVESSPRDVRSICRLCSAATTRIDFLCLNRGLTGAAAGASVVIGDVPPEGASMTGLSRSCSGKYSSSFSYITSGGGRGAQVISKLLSNLLILSLCFFVAEVIAPVRRGVRGGGWGM